MIVEIVPADSPASVAAVTKLFREYAASLNTDLCFQDFDAELASMPGSYSPPGGALMLARVDGSDAGCVGVRPLVSSLCEMKRLYVRPVHRGSGVGKGLARAALAAARRAGYARMRLDTLESMTAARGLYAHLGFREIESYRFNPVPGTSYLEIDLR